MFLHPLTRFSGHSWGYFIGRTMCPSATGMVKCGVGIMEFRGFSRNRENIKGLLFERSDSHFELSEFQLQ
jgi:hypothetical protein